MDVVFGNVGQIVVHHVRQLLDIQPAGGEVGGHQHAQLAALEVRQRARAVRLALVAVDRVRADAVAPELLGEAVGAVLGAREHEDLLPTAAADEVRQQLALAPCIHRMDDLIHQLGGRVAARDFHHDGIGEEGVRQLPDLLGERGGEQQVLPLLRQQGKNASDVADEAHVEHAIGLVQHQDLDAAQVDGLLLHVVEQPTRRGDQNLDAALERGHLRLDADPAVDYGGRRGQVRAIGAHAFLHLSSQLAGGCEDQHARRASPVG